MTASPQCLPLQQPDWHTAGGLDDVLGELARRPALVDDCSCLALQDELRRVARGEACVLQAGDCAERFAECAPHLVRAKASLLHLLADAWERGTGQPVVRIGRFAGQFAKPRSSPSETRPDGTVLPCYRGDAVNDPAPVPSARTPDPRRLLQAYDCAAMALGALAPDRLLLAPGCYGHSTGLAPIYVSHEALLLDYERALMREGTFAGSAYASSAHLVWIGDRTRQPGGPHVELAASVANPVGLKVGPAASPAEIRQVASRLVSGHPPGRLMIICRIGAHEVRSRLPQLLDAFGEHADQVVWMCDPMHGNTVRTRYGQKTRVVDDVLDEVEGFCVTLRARGVHPGGLHLEMTPRPVTECIDNRADVTRSEPLPCYETACDPRLNHRQAEQTVRCIASL